MSAEGQTLACYLEEKKRINSFLLSNISVRDEDKDPNDCDSIKQEPERDHSMRDE